jgi:hypothetical protein
MSDRTRSTTQSSRAIAPRAAPGHARTRRIGLEWTMPAALLAASALGITLVLASPAQAFAIALALVFGAAIVWMLVSVFSPARADRRCPRCAGETVERLDARSTRGIVCRACGHVDAESSSFLLAEDEGAPIEPMLLERRADGRRTEAKVKV